MMKMKRKIDSVARFVRSYFDVELSEFIMKIYEGESQDMILDILTANYKGEEIDIDKYVPEKSQKFFHSLDYREPKEMLCNIILGWITEDIIMQGLKDFGFKEVKLAGGDKNRTFAKNYSARPDLKAIEWTGEEYNIEVIHDFTSFWSRNGYTELRGNKYKKALKEENPYLIGIDYQKRRLLIVDLRIMRHEEVKSEKWGKKITKVFFHDSDFKEIEKSKINIRDLF